MEILYKKEFNYEIWYYLNEDGKEIWHNIDDKPAFIYTNSVEYWQHDLEHRLTGPAIILKNSNNKNDYYHYWYYKGTCFGSSAENYSQEQFEKELKLLVFK